MLSRANNRYIAPGQLLSSRQIIQDWIAESAAEIQAARLMVLHAAWKMSHLGQKAARTEISIIKFFVANVLQKVIDRALQTHGGLGMSDDTILSFFYRFERAARIYDGVDEVHKIAVAKRILNEFEKRNVR
jgi:alkylation response protein AidB-like acyl-CoA dehydrogenase